MQREILRAMELHGGLTSAFANRQGFLNCHGLPKPEFLELIQKRIVAPRVLTSQPLSIVWQIRDLAAHKETLAKIEKEAISQKIKEYAPGGFKLELRPELRGRFRT